MRLIPSDPDVQTIVKRIHDQALDLQPEFQRGEVWSPSKKKRLVDSILREWHVPPVHVIERSDGNEEVLDGQQRLTAIRDFVDGKLTIDGEAPPVDHEILALHGLTYDALPERWRRRFDRFSLRFIRLIDFRPDEPAELFFRLNQPTSLTSAEQRNAFYGAARDQVRKLVSAMQALGLTDGVLGFSNNRMAYHDTLAKVCQTVDSGSLIHKVTARAIEEVYRSKEGFTESSIERVSRALVLLRDVLVGSESFRFNKATLYSWLLFLICHAEPKASEARAQDLKRFLVFFEGAREGRLDPDNHELQTAVATYTDRATARVADVSSVLIRDVVLWLLFARWAHINGFALNEQNHRVRELQEGSRLRHVNAVLNHGADIDLRNDPAAFWEKWGRVP